MLLLKWLRVGCSFFDSFSHYLFVVFVFRSLLCVAFCLVSVGLVIVLVVDAKRTEKASANPVRRLQHLQGRSGWTTSVSSGAWGVWGSINRVAVVMLHKAAHAMMDQNPGENVLFVCFMLGFSPWANKFRFVLCETGKWVCVCEREKTSADLSD